MKKLLLISFLLALTNVFAQDADSYIEVLKSEIKTDKKAFITETMGFTEKESAAFWPIYNEFEYELEKLSGKRIANIKDFAANYDSLTNKKADEQIKTSFSFQSTKYYAYLNDAELTRLYVTEQGPKVEKVTIDLEKALAGDPASNLPLRENDQLFVRTVPEWKMSSQATLLGELGFPGTYTVRKGEKLSSLIERAGGFTGNAYPRGAVFTRESVRELQQKKLEESILRLERDLLAQGSARLSTAASPEELKAIEVEIRQTKEFLERLKTVRMKFATRSTYSKRVPGSRINCARTRSDMLCSP